MVSVPAITACTAEKKDKRRGEAADELGRRLRTRAENSRREPVPDIGGQPLLPFALEHGLDCRRLQRLYADHTLNQQFLGGRPAAKLNPSPFSGKPASAPRR